MCYVICIIPSVNCYGPNDFINMNNIGFELSKKCNEIYVKAFPFFFSKKSRQCQEFIHQNPKCIKKASYVDEDSRKSMSDLNLTQI